MACKENRLFIGVFATSVAIFSVWLFAFYPGNLSVDSINQLSQINSGVLTNAHPYIFTLFLGLFVKYLGGVASFAFFQILMSALIASLFATYFRKHDVKTWIIAVSLMAFWFSPAIGVYNVTIWKDVLFSQLIVLLAYTYLQILDSESPKKLIYLFLGLSLLVALARHNGAVYLVLSPALLYIFYSRCHPWSHLSVRSSGAKGETQGSLSGPPKEILASTRVTEKVKGSQRFTFKTMLVSIAALISIYLIINGPIASIFLASNNSVSNVNNAFRLQLVASILSSNDANLSSGDLVYYEKIMSKDEYVRGYRCSSIDGLIMKNNKKIDKYFSGNTLRQTEFISMSHILILKNIPIVIADRSCLLAYQLGLGMKNWYDPYYAGISANNLGYAANSNIPRKPFANFLSWSIHLPQRAIFWNHALTLLIYVVAFAYGAAKKNARIMGFVALVAINVPVLAMLGISNDFRYLYALTLGVIFIPGIILQVALKEKQEIGRISKIVKKIGSHLLEKNLI